MFRNLRFYQLGDAWPKSEDEISAALQSVAFKPCGPLTERSSGFMPIWAETDEQLARRVAGADLLRLRSQSRVLPHSAINEALELRVIEYQARMNEAPSAREKRRLKAETRDELMPKALLKSDKIWGYVDNKLGLLGIDAAQSANAERFIRRLNSAFDGLMIQPLMFEQPFNKLLTDIFLGTAPRQFAIGRECKMQDARDAQATVRWSQFDLQDPSIKRHVGEGMRLMQLAIHYDNVLSFVLNEDGVMTKIKLLGMEDDSDDAGDGLARLDTEFALMSGLIRNLMTDLARTLGAPAKT